MTQTAATQNQSTANIQAMDSDAFLDFAEYLYVILTHENMVMMNKGALSVENLMGYKRSLLERFDAQVEQIKMRAIERNAHKETADEELQSLMIAVRNIQKAIKLNVSLQKAQKLQDRSEMSALKQKLHAAKNGEGTTAIKETNKQWH